MANVYYEKDADRSLIADRKVAVLGYGSQGHAHALNLKDSGIDVRVGLREGSSSKAKAEAAGLRVVSTAEAARRGRPHHDPAARHRDGPVYEADVAPNLSDGDALFFAHGFNVRFGYVQAPAGVDVAWSRRRAPATSCAAPTPRAAACRASSRWAGRDRQGQCSSRLAYADAIGGARAGVLETTFEEETETDLFGEQVVLCGGLTALVQAGFETLVEAGYQPESAYFECLHELKLIVDLMYEEGISGMRYSISTPPSTATSPAGPRIITDGHEGRDAQDPRARSRPASSPRSSSARSAAAAATSTSCGPRARRTRSSRSAASCGR